MSPVSILLVLLVTIAVGETTVLPLLKALFDKQSYNREISDYYSQDCIYPDGYHGYAYTGYPSEYYNGYNSYARGYHPGYNGYARGYNHGYNGYARGYYPGYNGYARGYNGYTGGYNSYPYAYYNEYNLKTDSPRHGKTWSDLCKVHYPDSIGAPGKAGVVCL